MAVDGMLTIGNPNHLAIGFLLAVPRGLTTYRVAHMAHKRMQMPKWAEINGQLMRHCLEAIVYRIIDSNGRTGLPLLIQSTTATASPVLTIPSTRIAQ